MLEIIHDNNLTPTEFANKAGLIPHYVGIVLYRPHTIPSVDTVIKISDAFNIPDNEIYDFKANNKNYFFSELLLPELLKRRIGIKELANKTGIRSETMIELQNGKIKGLSNNLVIQIAKELNVSPVKWMYKIGMNKIKSQR